MSEAKILIVDDNPLNLKMLKIILKNENYEAILAGDGVEGIKTAEREKPDLIFLDIMMPGIDGFDVCKKLKANPLTADIPVIFLTAKSDTEGVVRGFEVGAADYVTRPFNRVELLARLKTHLALKKSGDKVLDLERRNSILAMIATTNHEINQPLTVLSGNLFLLQESLGRSNLNEQQIKLFERLERSVEKIKTILEKYRKAASMRFEKYSNDAQIVVFDDKEPNKNGS